MIETKDNKKGLLGALFYFLIANLF